MAVLTYNVYGFGGCPPYVVATIRAADADLVVFQELTPPVAEGLERELAEAYPYRLLAPDPGVIGMGAITRYPLRDTGETLSGIWFTKPQTLALDFNGVTVTVLNAHPDATPIARIWYMEETVRRREEQVRAVAAYVAAHPGPLIAPGDYNTTDRNDAYAILSGPLRGSWREAGRGPGHTFPGGPGSSLQWLIRIDYVFHSPEWVAVEARVLPPDGASDHRPLLARLALRR